MASQQPTANKTTTDKPAKPDTDQNTSLEQDLSPEDPTTSHAAAVAKRAMTATEAWKPVLDRRQSWDNQEYKHELLMSSIDDAKAGAGFTERK